ncbi:Hypothetical protein NocV09_02600980, partial [Nannochloropsis oceanica]
SSSSLGPIRSGLEFTADRLLRASSSISDKDRLGKGQDSSSSSSGSVFAMGGGGATATVTALSTDVGLGLGLWGGRQDAELSFSSGLAFVHDPRLPSPPSLHLDHGQAFQRMQAVTTWQHPLPLGLILGSRSLAYWASRAIPPYLAYRMGGHRFYVRGYDDNDFAPFSSLQGTTLEVRLPLMLTASGTRIGLSASAFVDYATGASLPSSSSSSAPSSSSAVPSLLSQYMAKGEEFVAGGLGLKAGPIKIDWAVNKRGEGKVHVSLADPSF